MASPRGVRAAGGTVRWFHHDQLGSTTSLTNASGATVQSYTYDAYGQLTSATPAVENPFRYAGQYTDDQTGFQDLRARYYDPATGQFLSRDPLEDSTLQPYAYADNNPTNTTDPSGLDALDFISNAAAGALDSASGGYSTELAGAFFHFDVDCADFGSGFGTGQMLGMVGGMFTGGGEAAAGARVGSRISRIARRFGDETGSFSVVPLKIERQMARRGWTHEQIDEAVKSGQQVRAANKANGNPATRYVHPTTGQSVVVDDVTGKVIHVGGPGFKYGPASGDLP